LPSSYIAATEREGQYIEEMKVKGRRQTLSSEGERKNIAVVEGSGFHPFALLT